VINIGPGTNLTLLRLGLVGRVKLLPGLLQKLEIGRADDNRCRLAELDDQVLGLTVINFIDNCSQLVA
jgi:hypothetical protein